MDKLSDNGWLCLCNKGKKALNLSHVDPAFLSSDLRDSRAIGIEDSLRLPLCGVKLTQESVARIPSFLRGDGCRPSDYLNG